MKKQRDSVRDVYIRIKRSEPIGWWSKTIDIPATTIMFPPLKPEDFEGNFKDYQGKQPDKDYNPFLIHEVHGLENARFHIGYGHSKSIAARLLPLQIELDNLQIKIQSATQNNVQPIPNSKWLKQ